MTPIDLAREVFPGKPDDWLDWAVWSRTGFPCFWDLKEGQTVEDKMREQLMGFRDALERCPADKTLCDHCNNFVSEGAWHCVSCDWNKCFEMSEV